MYVIYGLFDPRQPIEFLNCRYVGQTGQTFPDRMKGHIYDGRHGPNNHHNAWVKSLLRDDARPVMIPIEEVTVDTMDDREIFWIAEAKRLGCRLVNDPGKLGGKTLDAADMQRHRDNWAKNNPDEVQAVV